MGASSVQQVVAVDQMDHITPCNEARGNKAVIVGGRREETVMPGVACRTLPALQTRQYLVDSL